MEELETLADCVCFAPTLWPNESFAFVSSDWFSRVGRGQSERGREEGWPLELERHGAGEISKEQQRCFDFVLLSCSGILGAGNSPRFQWVMPLQAN